MTSPIIPVGGSTGLSHYHSAIVEEAARWLAEHRAKLTKAIVPTLRERFGLSVTEAIDAACLAVKYEFVEGSRCAS